MVTTRNMSDKYQQEEHKDNHFDQMEMMME